MEPITYALPDGTTTTDRPEIITYSDHVLVNGVRYERCQRALGIAPCAAPTMSKRHGTWDCGSHDR